ncbi:MAG: hypothetical protein WCH84_10220 [Verrucomicrobiota bacterium]
MKTSGKQKEFARKIKKRTFIPDGTLLDACPEISEDRKRAVWQDLVVDKIVNSAAEIKAEEGEAPTTVVVPLTIVNNPPAPIEKKAEALPRKKFTSDELAEMYGRGKRTIQQWAQDGVISSIPVNTVGQKRGKKVILFDIDQVEKDLVRWERKALGRS